MQEKKGEKQNTRPRRKENLRVETEINFSSCFRQWILYCENKFNTRGQRLDEKQPNERKGEISGLRKQIKEQYNIIRESMLKLESTRNITDTTKNQITNVLET